MSSQEETSERVSGAPAPRETRRPRFWILSTLGAVLLLAAAVAGGFFLGQAGRPSEVDLAAKVSERAKSDAAHERKMLVAQERELERRFDRRLKRATKKAAEEGQAAGYASGQSVGFSSGAATGRQQGMAVGEEKGKEEGEKEGKEKGKKAGLKEGREEGEAEGYSEGFEEGTCYDPETYEYVCD